MSYFTVAICVHGYRLHRGQLPAKLAVNARTPLTLAQIRKVYPVRLIPPIRRWTIHDRHFFLSFTPPSLQQTRPDPPERTPEAVHRRHLRPVHRRPMPLPHTRLDPPDVLTGHDADSTQGVRDPKSRLEDGAGTARRPSAADKGRQEQVESLTSLPYKVSAWLINNPAMSAMPRAREHASCMHQDV